MRRLSVSLLLLSIVGVLFSRAGRKQDAPGLPEPPDSLLPGQPLEALGTCLWWEYQAPSALLYCDHSPYMITYNTHDKRIEHISLYVYQRQLTAGDLVEGWGKPSGLVDRPGTVKLVWQNRFAYILSQPFSPDSRVVFLEWGVTSSERPWQGWTNHD